MPRKYVKKAIGEGGRRSYKNSDAMLQAFNAVKENQLGIRQAAEIYNVDYHSLLRRVGDACPLTAGVGRFTLLSEKEEADLATGITVCAEWGWGLRRDNVCSMVHHYLCSKGRGENGPPGPDWLLGFLSRHQNIVLRKSQQLSVVRIKSLTPDVGEKWLTCVEATYKKYKITRAEQVHNCDETGFTVDPAAGFVLAKKGSRVVTNIGGSGREQISVLGCCSAAGKMWPPLIIYKAKKMNVLWTSNGPPGTTFTVTDSGWMETDAFASWFTKSFIPGVSSIEGNKVLVYDGHSSHLSIPVLEAAIANNIVILRLPSHSSHVLQPLDVGVFGPMKKEWKKILQDWQRKNRFAKINKTNFPSLLNMCWIKGFKAPNAISGFKATGLWPFSRQVLKKTEFLRSEPLNTRPLNSLPNTVVSASNEGNLQANAQASASATGLELQQQDNDRQLEEPDMPSSSSVAASLGKENVPMSSNDPQCDENKPSTSSAGSPAVDMKDAFLDFFKSTTPPSNQSKRKSTQIRLFQYGECVTDSDMLERLREKEKLEKEKKKRKPLGAKPLKANKQKKLSNDSSSEEVEDVLLLSELCEVCVTDDEGVWIACNTCAKWFHVECAGLGSISKEQASTEDFLCFHCV